MIKVIVTHKIRTSHDSAESSVLYQSAQKHLSNITEPWVAAIKATTKGNKIRTDVAKAVEFPCILCRLRNHQKCFCWQMKTSHLFGSTQSITAAALQFLPGCHLQDHACYQIYSLFFSKSTLFRFYHFAGSVLTKQLDKAICWRICSIQVGQQTQNPVIWTSDFQITSVNYICPNQI